MARNLFHHPQVETPHSKLWLMTWSHLINWPASQQSDSATSPRLHTTWLSKYFDEEKFHWWWSHQSYFDEEKPYQCLEKVIKAALMKKSHVDVLVKSSKLLWWRKASSMSWKSLQSLVNVLVKSLKLLWWSKASSISWWSHQSCCDEEKPCQCLGKVIKATLMYKSLVHVLKKSSKPHQRLRGVIEATLMSWWSHWSYFDVLVKSLKLLWCLGEVIEATLMSWWSHWSYFDVLVKSLKLLWCLGEVIEATLMSWWSHWSYFDVLVKSLKLLCQAGLQYIKNGLYQSGALLLSSNQLARLGVWQCNSCIVVDEV